MEQMSLFDMEESAIQFDVTKKLQVVKSKFLEAQSVSWQDLFEGFDEMYAITFSSGIYSYPDGALTHELKYICDELPPKLKAKVASRSLVMELDMACEFFGIKFKKSIF